MKYKIIFATVACVVVFVGGYLSGYYSARKTVTGITQSSVNWENGTVNTNVNNIDCETAKQELKKYYTSEPTLELTQKDNEINAVAGLCDRMWSRSAKLNFSKPENFVFGGAGIGLHDKYYKVGYFRLFGNIGLGGELEYNNTGNVYAGIIIGCMF